MLTSAQHVYIACIQTN